MHGRGRGCAAALVSVLSTATLVVALGSAALTEFLGGSAGDVIPTADAERVIPPAMLGLYMRAASSCPGLAWTVLAAIGTVESDNGRSTLPGVHAGSNPAGAEGPMQFEPATFAAYALPVPAGGAAPPSPYDATDATFAAARLLCANGARDDDDLRGALYAYDHDDGYVDEVLTLAASFGTASVGAPSPAAAFALRYALAQVGTPYRWGAEAPDVGFDCSGLVQAAYAAAGVELPRVAQAQFDAGPPLAPGDPLRPGDLVFFGLGPDDVTHVGMVVDPTGVMVDAPHTGADVRVEPFPTTPGASWGSELVVGMTRPAP